MGMNRKTGRGAKFLIVFVVIVIIMAAVTFFAGKYAYHLLREYIEYASKQSTEVVLEKDGLKGRIEWMSAKEKEKLSCFRYRGRVVEKRRSVRLCV